MGALEFKIRKLAVLVSPGHARRCEQSVSAHFQAAFAAHNSALSSDGLPSTSTTDGANFSGNFYHGLYIPLCTVELLPASGQCGSPVHKLCTVELACAGLRKNEVVHD